MNLLVLMLSILLVANVASAGERIGNGGNAVVCYADSTKQSVVSVEMFDLWEMEQEFGHRYKIDMPGDSASIEANIKSVLKKIAIFDTLRSKQYEATAMQILSDIPQILVNEDLPVINDDRSKFVPNPPCFKEQFAVQVKEPEEGENRFEISRRIWEDPKTSNIDRASLILHEVIYRDLIENGQTTSDKTRVFNYLASTNFLTEANVQEYTKLAKESGFNNGLVTVLDVKFGNKMYVMQFLTRSISVGKDYIIGSLVNEITLDGPYVFGKLKKQILRRRGYDVDPEKDPRITLKTIKGMYYVYALHTDHNYYDTLELTFITDGKPATISDYDYNWSMTFNENGFPMKAAVNPTYSFKTSVSGQDIICSSVKSNWSNHQVSGDFFFWENQNLRMCYTAVGSIIKVNGKNVKVSKVSYKETGILESVKIDEETLFSYKSCQSPIAFKKDSLIFLDQKGQLDVSASQVLDGAHRSKLKLAYPSTLSYEGTVYEPEFKNITFSSCVMKSTFFIEVSSKNKFLLTVPSNNKDAPKEFSKFCKAEGFENGKVHWDGEQDYQVEQMFTKVFDLVSMKLKDAPLGSSYKKIKGFCSKTIDKNL